MNDPTQPPPIPGSSVPPPVPAAPDRGFDPFSAPPTYPGRLGSGALSPHRVGIVLALGITSLAFTVFGNVMGLAFPPCCGSGFIGLILAIVGWVMANTDLAQMTAGTMDASGRSNTQAGKVCSIITVVLAGLSLLAALAMVVLGLGLFAAAAAAGGGSGAQPFGP